MQTMPPDGAKLEAVENALYELKNQPGMSGAQVRAIDDFMANVGANVLCGLYDLVRTTAALPTVDRALRRLSMQYVEWIGYDPFENDHKVPAIEVANSLEQFADEAKLSLPDETVAAVRIVRETWQ